MILSRNQRAVGVFTDRRNVEQALYELRDIGLAMDQVSVVVKNADEPEIKEYKHDKADEGATVGGLSGGAVGSLIVFII
ncbi:hypothetical protein [Nostoc sp. PCC 7107]|uniref:hypothetical protein n=1 Tax=Nostoc sp. PCC 7107 TaxID=317936 RepID=UPI00029F2C61|nr:hypothetical protein [Nostoc sp. PCC 7107]AFY43792.1 hypothetical protein Nos7107_3204 [Nostoc sp. PCC 7107]